jgi:heme/copper-type cytochrome/quinol oxidase subunit 1
LYYLVKNYSFNNSDDPITIKYSNSFFSWGQLAKARTLYVANNWIYTTNHKRIAVNYFWFVILSGIVGMVLATIIRLEMAYPGVGILAGDSLQYLTVVTAHAVVMVFFMIMPLLFGAFANFLIPTQLGVHDVAFPRLNSAAFWFLPAGFLMLCQLVCIDRRYQRMNCFNIREVQTLLRSKYHPSFLDIVEHHQLLERTVVGLRFKLFGLDSINSNMSLAFEHYISKTPTNRSSLYKNLYIVSETRNTFFSEILCKISLKISDYVSYYSVPQANKFLISLDSINGVNWLSTYDLKESISLNNLTSFNLLSSNHLSDSNWVLFKRGLTPSSLNPITFNSYLYPITGELFILIPTLTYLLEQANLLSDSTFYVFNLILNPVLTLNNMFFNIKLSLDSLTSSSLSPDLLVNLFNIDSWSIYNSQSLEIYSKSKSWSSSSVENQTLNSGEELSSNTRRVRASNPVVGYSFKVGDFYPSNTISSYPSIIRSLSDITRGVRRAHWSFNPLFSKFWRENFGNYMHRVHHTLDFPITEARLRPSTISNNASFYNFFYLISQSSKYINRRWISLNSLDQKMYRMFMSASMQQRIYASWRNLKFHREGWRCRLLASRHQKTLYRRFGKEESLVWSVEKNAKDVLPGWAMITPFSGRVRYTAIGKVDLGLMGVFLVLNSSIVSSSNFLVTYRYLSTLNNRKMRDARSFFTEGIMVASWMMIAANPMLAIGILMLLSDRHWQTCFFDYSGGGDTVLFQHMFWFFGHPEVYVIMIPAFGFNNTLLSFYLRKRISARASLMDSLYTIAFLGFFVWGHHMYMVGLAHTTRMLFSTLTVMISVPAATKLMHWCVTLVNSSFWVELPFVFCLLFIFFFVSGGISGMAVANTGMDILFHDSFYVIGHFHVMFAGAAMFASFGAFYFYFPSILGLKFSRIWGYLHCTYFSLGQLMTVVPMIWLGYSGMPRRVLDYPASLGGWHAIVSAGHLLSVAGLTAFFIMIFDSMRQGRPATRNNFGVSRFNTRLSFYAYESARLLHIQNKGWYVNRYPRTIDMVEKVLHYRNNELIETTLYSYVFIKKGNDSTFHSK